MFLLGKEIIQEKEMELIKERGAGEIKEKHHLKEYYTEFETVLLSLAKQFQKFSTRKASLMSKNYFVVFDRHELVSISNSHVSTYSWDTV